MPEVLTEHERYVRQWNIFYPIFVGQVFGWTVAGLIRMIAHAP